MKKIRELNYFARISQVRLYRDDIESIIEILRRDSFSVRFEDDNFEYESLDEIAAKRGTRLKKLVVYATRDKNKYTWDSIRVTIESTRDGTDANVHATNSTPFYEIRDLLQSKQRRHYAFIRRWLLLVICIPLAFFAAFKLDPIANYHNRAPFPKWPVYTLLFAIILPSLVYTALPHPTGLSLVRQHQGTFWKRNADKIWLVLITAIVGAAFGILSTLVTQHFTKP